MGVSLKRANLDFPGEWWEYPLPSGGTGHVMGSEQHAQSEVDRIYELYHERVQGAKKGREVFTLTRICQLEIGQQRRRPAARLEDLSDEDAVIPIEMIRGY